MIEPGTAKVFALLMGASVIALIAGAVGAAVAIWWVVG